MNRDQANQLREPFPANAIGKLPKGRTSVDYVGHAAVTERLLAVDPGWTWEPLSRDERGAPLVLFDQQRKVAALWIVLTVCGVSRIEVGTATIGDANLEKTLVSDAITRAAMRFGVALDLWSKEELTGVQPDVAQPVVTDLPPASAGRIPTEQPDEQPDEQPSAPANEHQEAIKHRAQNIAFIRSKVTGRKPDEMRQMVEDCLPDEARGQWNALADLSAEHLQMVRDKLQVMG